MLEPSDTDIHSCPENVQEYIAHLQGELIASEVEVKRQFAWGMMKAINDIRLHFWGFGYDKDDTAIELRKMTCDKFLEIKEMMHISYIGDDMWSDAKQVFDDLKKQTQ